MKPSEELVATADAVLEEAARRKVEVVLPDDVVNARHPGDRAMIRQCPAARILIAMNGLDIGPLTLARFREALRDAATVLWNGPVGMLEHPPFAAGTMELARILAEHPGWTVAAGSDTTAAVRQADGYVSTAGTAFLEALEGRQLPGVAGLSEARPRKHGSAVA